MGRPEAGDNKLFAESIQKSRLELGLQGQWNVDRHLVSVKVCVERRAGERMQLNRLSFDQDRLKSLYTQTV